MGARGRRAARPRRGVRGSRQLKLARADELFGADLRSLAALRIGLGLVVLADLAARAPDLRAHYTDAGVLTRADLLSRFGWLHAWPLCVHLAGGSAWSQGLLFAAAAVAAGALVLGVRTTLATVVVWFLTTSLQLRNLYIGGGYDALLRMVLLWGCFLPLGARWSVDAGRRGPGLPPPARVLSVATVALVAQIVIVYWSAAVAKWHVTAWQDGTALAAILADDFRTTGLGAALGRHPGLLRFLGHAVVGVELGAPLLLFVPVATGPVRTAAVLALALMNAGFGLGLELGLFPWIGTVALVGLLPGWFWDRIGRAAPAPRVTGRLTKSLVGQGICAVLLTYVVGWCVGVARDPAYRAPEAVEWLGGALFLQQDWRMFAVPPERTGWISAPGQLVDGTALDLFAAGGRLPDVADDEPPPPVRVTRPPRPSRDFASDRWRLFIARAAYGPERDMPLLGWGRFLCREWNARHAGGRQLEQFDVVFVARRIGAGVTSGYAREVVWRHHCFG
jgi:Vitamin K-dependent gamma-carboxylase